MKFVFLFLGKTREKYIDAGIRDFVNRLKRFVKVECILIKECPSGKIPEDVQKKQEARNLLDKCPDSSFLIALDPGGKELDSISLASAIAAWEESGQRSLYFIIGGHYGLDEDILQRADFILSLSRLTFTHEMSRLILLEQLYRCCMINAGRNYHY